MDRQLIYIILAAAIIIFVGMYIRDWLVSRKTKQQQPTTGSRSNAEITLPLTLQAYERLVLFLERIKPEILIGRVSQSGLTAREMRSVLSRTIQAEFEHNLSQQIYVSISSWDAVCNAKEQLISLINSLADQLPPEASGNSLNKKLLELSLGEKDFPIPIALSILNTEAKKLIS